MLRMLRKVLWHLPSAALLGIFLVIVTTALAQSYTDPEEASAVSPLSTSVAAPASSSALPITKTARPTSNSVSFGIVIDESSAMRADPSVIRAAVNRLIKPMGDEDEAFVVVAKEKPTLLQDFTSDPEEIDRSLRHLKFKGRTPLFDSIITALNHFEDASNERTALIVLASGEDDVSNASLAQVREKLASTRTPVYCIAAKNASWDSQGVLQELAAASHGSALFPRRDKDFTDASGEITRRMFGENALAAKRKPLAPYDLAIVKSIPVANGPETSNIPDGDNVILQKMLVRNLRAKGLFTQVVDDTTPDGVDQSTSTAQAQTQSNPLEVMGTIVQYQPADQRQARFLRMGGRSAIVKVQFLFRDGRTGKIVMKSIAEGKVDTGFLGGSAEKVETQAVLRAVDKVVEDIARNR